MKAKELIKILSKNPDHEVKIVDEIKGLCEIEEINTKQDYYEDANYGTKMPEGEYFLIEYKWSAEYGN